MTAEQDDEPFVLGCNYWPRKRAMQMWNQFSAAEIRNDFRAIRSLGMTLVRIFLMWHDFQPDSPDSCSDRALGDLKTVADLAVEFGLRLDVTFFTGHMSGPQWLPRWMLVDHCDDDETRRMTAEEKDKASEGSNPHKLQVIVVDSGAKRSSDYGDASDSDDDGGITVLDPDARYRNPFHDPEALRGQLNLAVRVAESLREHCGVAMWNLGNEIDLIAAPRSPLEGVKWAVALRDAIRAADSVKPRPVTCGLHADSLRFSSNNVPVSGMFGQNSETSAQLGPAVMHAYPQYVSWLCEQDPLNPNFVPFTCAMTAAMISSSFDEMTYPRCSVLAEEFGACTAPPGAPSQTWKWNTKSIGGEMREREQFMAGEPEFADYLQKVLLRLHATGARAAVLWCWADYASSLWRKAPCSENLHERYFGLVRPDGTLKPHANVIRAFAETKPMVKFDVSPTTSMTTKKNGNQLIAELQAVMREMSKKEDISMWVRDLSDAQGSCDVAVQELFEHFEAEILPKYL